MLKCREVTEFIGTDALGGAPLGTRIRVQFHLLMCRHCRSYARSLREIAETARRLATKASPASDVRADEVLRTIRKAISADAQGHDKP